MLAHPHLPPLPICARDGNHVALAQPEQSGYGLGLGWTLNGQKWPRGKAQSIRSLSQEPNWNMTFPYFSLSQSFSDLRPWMWMIMVAFWPFQPSRTVKMNREKRGWESHTLRKTKSPRTRGGGEGQAETHCIILLLAPRFLFLVPSHTCILYNYPFPPLLWVIYEELCYLQLNNV